MKGLVNPPHLPHRNKGYLEFPYGWQPQPPAGQRHALDQYVVAGDQGLSVKGKLTPISSAAP